MIHVIVLAADNGSDAAPSILLQPVGGIPMIRRALIAAELLCHRPTVVVRREASEIMRQVGSGCDFVHPRRGSCAVRCALEASHGSRADEIVVMPADRPLLTVDTLAKVVLARYRSGAALAFAAMTLPDFEGPRSAFAECGRIRRDSEGRVLGILGRGEWEAAKEASHEVDAGYYCFRPDWLRANVAALAARASGAYDVSDLVAAAVVQGQEIRTVAVDDGRECLSVKTPDQLLSGPAER